MRFRPLHARFGVEVLDFDLSSDLDGATIAALRQAYDEHQLLLFRGGERLSPERQVAITGWFGEVATHFDGKMHTVLSNENAYGRDRLPFHSDYTFTETPFLGISLHAAALPDGGTGTSFISAVDGWASLPAERQAALADLTLRHREVPLSSDADRGYGYDHPLRLIHPKTGQPILFVTEHHANRIHELPQAESDRVIAEIFAHLYRDEAVYDHRWQPYDLMVWDNLAIQHARSEQVARSEGKRDMQRVTMHHIGLAEVNARAKAYRLPPLAA
jgi:taurine dioxygenase